MDFFTTLIIALGIAVFCGLAWWGTKIITLLRTFDVRCIDKKSDRITDVTKDGQIGKNSFESIIYNEVELEKHRDSYETSHAIYSAVSQLVPLFPLLGILGTVYGLFKSDLKDVDSLVQGLNLALRTTIAGLIVSIFLKCEDSFFCYHINMIDAKFEKADAFITRNDMKRELAIAKEDLKREGY